MQRAQHAEGVMEHRGEAGDAELVACLTHQVGASGNILGYMLQLPGRQGGGCQPFAVSVLLDALQPLLPVLLSAMPRELRHLNFPVHLLMGRLACRSNAVCEASPVQQPCMHTGHSMGDIMPPHRHTRLRQRG